MDFVNKHDFIPSILETRRNFHLDARQDLEKLDKPFSPRAYQAILGQPPVPAFPGPIVLRLVRDSTSAKIPQHDLDSGRIELRMGVLLA